ncbi:hypothetical protein PMAYCL1PPCAC_10103, partial [Pristionchus mayeri]
SQLQESRSSTSVLSSSQGDSDVETALSFNLSQISTAQSFDHDELFELMNSKRSRRQHSQEPQEVQVEVANLLDELPVDLREAYNRLVSNAAVSDLNVPVDQVPHLLIKEASDRLLVGEQDSPLVEALHASSLLSARTDRPHTEIRQVSAALIPGARRERSFTEARSVAQSQSDTSMDRDTFDPCYSTPAITESAAATPEQTRLSYSDNYSVQRSLSLETAPDEDEGSGWAVEPAEIVFSLTNSKHGVKMDLGITMTLNAPGGSLVVAAVTVPK